ncbi:nucleoside-diphosphate-sugar epimerase [Azospirillum brasilense]|uniref:Nucleoside-diphosphate-sugar epimerase n=1 Tax=Azospirillum brasilense TaxID=192 RepID=A0A560BWQ8_AZOBR|nr:NAD-dependent epimerase/dehydratase family protein [Azospirillum brasilense]MBK3732719.1 NAD-dependent epimerase/dehydratase family protein [Azospirillum brasilense]TWA77052.1 nucleoside-diphosphate-sugar epimerase [Azospirillum brasilense]
MTERTWHVLVTGGAGYVGSALVPRLLDEGHSVTVLDLYIYGDVFAGLKNHPRLTEIRGDLRDPETVARALRGCDAVIHLACISNDPSFDLDPALGRSINYECFRPLVRAAKEAGVERFVYASSSSVYGIKEEENVTEDLPLQPLTDYSKFKALCEEVLQEERAPGFTVLTVRPATVCGYAPRLRLDLSVNILTNHAINAGKIKVFGGSQKRPNIHVADMVEFYVRSLAWDASAIDGKVFNVGYENHTIMQIAEMVRDVIGASVAIEVTPTDDLRSYHISSDKIRRELGFTPAHSIADAVRGLKTAFDAGSVPDSMSDPRYFNIKTMQQIALK